MDRLLDIVWPDMIGPQGIAGRLGRVLFWLGSGLAGLLAALGVALAFVADPSGALPLLLMFWGAAAIFYLAGRGACYLLAGE